jgi:hypothetical protein
MPVMKITVDAAMRARDVSRPHADQEASARSADTDLAGQAHATAEHATAGPPEGQTAGTAEAQAETTAEDQAERTTEGARDDAGAAGQPGRSRRRRRRR